MNDYQDHVQQALANGVEPLTINEFMIVLVAQARIEQRHPEAA